MQEDISEVLLDSESIARRVEEIASELGRRLAPLAERDEPVVLVPVLTGSLVFTADLIRHLPQKMRLDVVTVSSYAGATTESRGATIRGAVPEDMAGRHVVLVDDIFDTGNTLSLLNRSGEGTRARRASRSACCWRNPRGTKSISARPDRIRDPRRLRGRIRARLRRSLPQSSVHRNPQTGGGQVTGAHEVG